MNANPTRIDRLLAKVCAACPVCRTARARPGGGAAAFVRTVERKVCPFCRAYERVHGRPSHQAP